MERGERHPYDGLSDRRAMAPPGNPKDVASQLGGAVRRLIRDHLALAQLETRQDFALATRRAIVLSVLSVAVMSGVVLLAVALGFALGAVLGSLALGFLIAGAALIVVCGVPSYVLGKRLAPSRILDYRDTEDELRRDERWLKDTIRPTLKKRYGRISREPERRSPS